MAKKGEYYEMVMAQSLTEITDGDFDVITREDDRPSFIQRSISMTNHDETEHEDDISRLKKELEEESAEKGTLFKLITYSKPITMLIFAGMVVGCIHGFCMPALGIVTSKMVDVCSSFELS